MKPRRERSWEEYEIGDDIMVVVRRDGDGLIGGIDLVAPRSARICFKMDAEATNDLANLLLKFGDKELWRKDVNERLTKAKRMLKEQEKSNE